MILLPYRFCGDSHHAFAFPFVLIFLPLRLSCKESSTSNQAFSIVFTTPSVPLIGDRNLRRKDVTALLGARNRCALRMAEHQRSRQIVRDGTAGVLVGIRVLFPVLQVLLLLLSVLLSLQILLPLLLWMWYREN